MYRRMSLGLILLLLLVILAGPTSAFAEPLGEPARAATVDSFDLLDWAWDWLTSLVSDSGGSSLPGGGHIDDIEGGAFIDPLGGNS
ncbi:MAG TPA: hypothetical protein VKM72_22550 [Thermoanaerobaculia bacterium]|nr:hypothetical protein [Thermoanaerobaculia bacterium]